MAVKAWGEFGFIWAAGLGFLCFLGAACSSGERTSTLVQPEKWWSIHPRPVYSRIEKVGTFQDWFDVYRLAEGTFAIYEPNQFEEALSYLVLGSEKAALVDTGTGIGDIRRVVEALTDLPVGVVLTHEHYDHVAGAWRFDEIVHADSPAALKVLAAGRDNASLQKYIAGDYLWKPLPLDFDSRSWTIPAIVPTRLVKDGETIDLGGRSLEVIATPGHSPGQVCLLDQGSRILFSGDHFFPGPLYAHASDVNVADYIASNRKLIQRLDEFDHICSGHNDPWVDKEVLPRVSRAFETIYSGQGQYAEDKGLRRYGFDGFDVLIRADQVESVRSGYPPVEANLVFFYYRDLENARRFYEEILGLERVLDYGFASIYRITQSSYLGVVDENRGMHRASEPKTVTLSFVTAEIDGWYEYLKSCDVPVRGPIRDATRHATRGFVAFDPEGYFLEFERFLDHPENAALHSYLEGQEAVYPAAGTSTRRPANLGLLANVIWLYYRDIPAAQEFYERTFGATLLVDQGFAKVVSSSPSGFIGLVDEAQGLHRFSENKAVTIAFITDSVDDWFIRLDAQGLTMKEEIGSSPAIPVRAFVTLDPAGYYLEFDRFLDNGRNQKLLSFLNKEG
jgi:glyoxylase-like metal-dependent hydrolase (beta-lactamase superfamily II)/catechol 2,3-dioxygenase-like lactoylglutathione lyase family enzyme